MTQWSLVARAAGDGGQRAATALADLCGRYWYPLYAYARRHAHKPPEAQDLVQEFFAHLLEKRALAAAQPERGRFRGFLLTALRNFLANERDKALAAKRGGGYSLVSIDFAASESRYSLEPVHHLTPEKLFDRQWALAVLDVVMRRLRDEQIATGRERQFAAFKEYLAGQSSSHVAAEAAEALHVSPEAARQALHRLRKRYRELLRAEIAQTVADPEQVDDELRALRTALE